MMKMKVEKIGPDEAKELLSLNKKNFRKPDAKRVDAYSREMKAGKWVLNGESIKVGKSGLLDGQHRLGAVIKAGVTVEMVVIRDLDCDGRGLDRGKPRSLGQWLSHEGVKNACDMAASGKLCVSYQKGMWAKQSLQVVDVLDSEILSFVMENETQLQNCVRVAMRSKQMLSTAILSSILFFGCDGVPPEDSEVAKWFCESLAKGENIGETDAVFHLRNRLLQQGPAAMLTPFIKRALATIAWNKTVAGDSCTSSSMRLRLTGPSPQKAPGVISVIK